MKFDFSEIKKTNKNEYGRNEVSQEIIVQSIRSWLKAHVHSVIFGDLRVRVRVKHKRKISEKTIYIYLRAFTLITSTLLDDSALESFC